MGDTLRPIAEDNIIPLFANSDARTSGTVPVAHDYGTEISSAERVNTEGNPSTPHFEVVKLQSEVSDGVDDAIASIAAQNFPFVAANNDADDESPGLAKLDANDEIYQYPELVEFIRGIDPGYEVVAITYARMRISIREQLVDSGMWTDASNAMPDRVYWHEPIALNQAVDRLEDSALRNLASKTSDLKLSEDEQDEAYDDLFGTVACIILLMERRFLNFKFDDDFIASVCDELIDSVGQKNTGVRDLIVEKLKPDMERFLKRKRVEKWEIQETVFPGSASPIPAEMDAE